MPVNVIAMLTHDDKTVPDALEIFEKNKHALTNCWGFKDIGISVPDATKLATAMKAAGKTTFLEPLLEDEQSCLNAARMAIACGLDCVVSMVFNEKVFTLLRDNGIKYMPTCGRREGLPRMLYGTPEEIIDDAKGILDRYAVDGVCLSSYRYVDGDPEDMSLRFNREVDAPLIVSGGINSYARLDFVKKLRPWGFTIGSALFMEKFGKGKTVAEQLNVVQNYIESR